MGGTSAVDESLFGTDSEKDRAIRSGASSTFSSSSNKNGKRKVSKNDLGLGSAVIVTNSQLQSIKASAIIKTEQELQADREELERLKEEKMKKQRERKMKMIALGEQAKKAMKKSDVEVQKEARERALRAASQVMQKIFCCS